MSAARAAGVHVPAWNDQPGLTRFIRINRKRRDVAMVATDRAFVFFVREEEQMRRLFNLAASGLAASGLGVSVASATEIWSADGRGLIKFDSASPQALTFVGESGIGLPQGLDFAPNGILYAFQSDSLYTLDLQTGAGTLVGSSDLQDERVLDMSWDPATNQMLIVTALTSDEPHHLRAVNLASGATSVVGTLNLSIPAMAFGLAVNASGVRYLHDGDLQGMVRLNSMNGVFMGPEGNEISTLEGMTINWSGDGAWYHGGLNGATGRPEFWSINEATGVGSFIGNIGGDEYEFNIGDLAIQPVPEPTAFILVALSALALRRR